MLTERIPLPELDDQPGVEQWAEIRAVKELRSGDRKAVRRAWRMEISENGLNKSFSMADEDEQREVLLARIIVSWSLAEPLPVADPESLERLPLDVYDALVEATKEHFRIVDFSPSKTPDGTGGSSGSATSSADTSSPDSSPTPD